MAETIHNPRVPYRGVIPITPGNASSVTIAGTVPKNCKRFSVNFETQNGDNAFHFNPRFDEGQNVVVRNTRKHGTWGAEERGGGCPFKKGGGFVLKIILGNKKYRVHVNGTEFCHYVHRIDKMSLKYITIEQDVSVTEICYDNGRNPPLKPNYPAMPAPPGYNESMRGGGPAAGMCIPPPGHVMKAPGGHIVRHPPPVHHPPPPPAHFQPPPPLPAPQPPAGSFNMHGMMAAVPPAPAPMPFPSVNTAVNNPPVPYRGFLPMAPGHGSSVIINGTVPSWCNRFQFNLETDNGDVAMHFNPRFEGTNAVIRNTCRQGNWESEERHGYFPFHLGAPFEVVIAIEEPHYKISVNHQHFCEYRHRIPKDYVRQLTIEGDIQISQIRFQGGATPLYNPPMPVNVHIPGGLHPGKMVRITGQSSYNPSRFNVNLVQGSGYNSNADIGLHCDVRFHYGDSHNVVVRTHRERGGWGSEERHAPFFPFVPGQQWEMIVRAEHDKYMIAVNNQHMFEFRHRLHPMHRFDHLYIEGDVNISMVQFQ